MPHQLHARMHLAMTRFADREHRRLMKEARRPDLIAFYNLPEQLERIWQQIQLARRFEWPSEYECNV